MESSTAQNERCCRMKNERLTNSAPDLCRKVEAAGNIFGDRTCIFCDCKTVRNLDLRTYGFLFTGSVLRNQ